MTGPDAYIGLDAALQIHHRRSRRRRRGVAPPRLSAAHDAAWEVLTPYVRHRMEDGTVLFPDTRGRWHSLRVQRTNGLIAKAEEQDEAGDRATLSTGLAEAIEDACLGLWGSPSFLPAVGRGAELPAIPLADALPLGLERLALSALPEGEAPALARRRDVLELVRERLTGPRRQSAEHMRRLALKWVWAHEIAHMIGGHLRVEALQADAELTAARVAGAFREAKADSTRSEPTPAKISGDLALELEADRVAAVLVLANAGGEPKTMEPLFVAAFACAQMLFHAEDLILGRSWTTTTHPSAGLRLRSILDARAPYLGRTDWRLAFLTGLASAAGHCAQWVGSVETPELGALANVITARSEAALAPVAENLEAQTAELIPDHCGISRDLRIEE